MGILNFSQYVHFRLYLLTIVDNFYVSLLVLKSILSFNLMQFKKEKEEQK